MSTLRLLLPAALALVGLSACGGSGSVGNVFGGNPQGFQCQTGTSQQVVSPTPGQLATNVNQITIVTNGNSNSLYTNTSNWHLYVTGNYAGGSIQGGTLSLVSDTGAPHPYSSDFYYTSTLSQTLPPGVTWQVYLSPYNNTSGCQDIPLQSFST